MTIILIVVGALITLRFTLVRRRRAIRLRSLREDASRLSYDQARARYLEHCQSLTRRMTDPLRRLRDSEAEAQIERAICYYERMIELETGHAGPAVRLSIRPKLRRLYKTGAAGRPPPPHRSLKQ